MKKMKRLIIIFAILLISQCIQGQVIISPYVAYADNKEKSTTVFVTNNSLSEQEIQMSLRFGHPVSDSFGNTVMEYPDSTIQNPHDITQYIKIFPKKFFLAPGEQQAVRLTIRLPFDKPAGTYWTRLVTTSRSKDNIENISDPQFAKVKLVLSQVTTLIYKNKKYENSFQIKEITHSINNDNLNLMTSCSIKGDPPFFTDVDIKVFDSGNNLVLEKQEYYSIYGDFNRKTTLDIERLNPGEYCAEIRFQSNERKDIPQSDKPLKDPILKKVYFTVK